MTMRNLTFLSLCVFTLAFAACGDEDSVTLGADCASTDECDRGQLCEGGVCVTDSSGSDTGTTDTGTDTSGDTPTLDVGVGTDTSPGECASGIECVRTSDCAGLENGQCIAECCVEGTPPVGDACSGHLDACTSDTQTTDDFFCDADEGQCLQRCDFDTADDTQSADCPLNSYCLSELTVEDPDALNGVCIPGDCDSNIFDTDACDGTGSCFPVGNGASYCIEGGTAGEGDECNTITDSQPASDICGPGMLCFQGECIVPCQTGEDGCDDLDCVSAFDVTPRNRPGVCGTECPEFSGGSCGEGESCSIIPGRFGINAWMCIEVDPDATTVGAGEDCSSASVECEGGTICIGTDDVGGAECASICDPVGESDAEFASCIDEAEVCTPSALSGFGFCQEGCEPYPRGPGSYGCDEGSNTCLPFVSRDDRPVEPLGFCTGDEGFAAAYEECSNDGFLGGDCLDFAVCLALEEGDASACLPLCEPFGDDQCGSGNTCSGIPPLVGQLNFSFCMADPQPGNIGDRCAEEGVPCAADHSICITETCLAVCRDGFDDCAEFGGTCDTGSLNPDVVPPYMGLCN
jgi:hypothetical protein